MNRIAEKPEDLLSRDLLLSMDGLSVMRGMLDGSIARPPISGVMNQWLHSVEPGRVAFRGIPEFRHSNPMGATHGGWYGTLADSALGCVVMTAVPRGSVYTTLEYKVNITRAIPIGMEVEAMAVLQHSGRSTGVADCEIRGVADGRVYATASTTCIIMAG